MRRVLMVAFHFPPCSGGSGIQRTLRFAQHLPAFGWQPLILTAQPRVYESRSDDLLKTLPDSLVVHRAFALNAARDLAFKGRYMAATARPDRWVSWRFDAVRQGMRMIKAYRPALIWSTYPIATAHMIGAELSERSGVPWVADFRDPMAQQGYPADPTTWRQFKTIEERAVTRAVASTFTTPGALRTYRRRYPDCANRLSLLENGYDEESFALAGQAQAHGEPLNQGGVTLLHSGVVYPEERDPGALFAALRVLREDSTLPPFKIRFRAAVHDQLLRNLAREYQVEQQVEVLHPVPYVDALSEMMRADGLLVLQAANCNEQIPAKVYEYLRARRPILALTDLAGDTAGMLKAAGVEWVAPLDDISEIAASLGAAVRALANGYEPLANEMAVISASRQARTETLARMFDACLGKRPAL